VKEEDTLGLHLKQIVSELQTASIALHELFVELTNAGFTEDQALKYMAYMSRKDNLND